MTLIVPNSGDELALNRIINKTASNDLKLHLYRNDYTPDKDTTVNNFTECSDTSYQAKTLSGTNWTTGTVAQVTTTHYPEQTFTFSSSQNVFGYFITDSTNNTVVFCERFGHVFAIGSDGGQVKVTLNWIAN